ncbi:MAG TPA: hypothetical protein VGZ92_15060 [Bradyrhizobium sp.]|nr:hypothetical protein [Bradyrhizobium sp.]
MPSSDNHSSENRGIDWRAIIRTLLVQVLVLLALSGAFIRYLDWSSNAALAEFVAASKPPAPDPGDRAQSSIPVQTAKRQAPCDRRS